MQFPPLPCYLVPLRPKYSPQHPVLKHPQPSFLSQCQRPSFAPIQNNSRISYYLFLTESTNKMFCVITAFVSRFPLACAYSHYICMTAVYNKNRLNVMQHSSSAILITRRWVFSRLSEFYCTCGHRSAIRKYGPLHKLWNPKIRHRVHDSPSLVTILSQENPVHSHSSCFFKIYFNVIAPFTPRSSMWFLSLSFLVQHCTNLSPLYSTRVSRPDHLMVLDCIILHYTGCFKTLGHNCRR